MGKCVSCTTIIYIMLKRNNAKNATPSSLFSVISIKRAGFFFRFFCEIEKRKKPLFGAVKMNASKISLRTSFVCLVCVDKDVGDNNSSTTSNNNNHKYNNDNHVRNTVGMCFCIVHVHCITIQSSSIPIYVFQQFRIAYICLKTYYARYWI